MSVSISEMFQLIVMQIYSDGYSRSRELQSRAILEHVSYILHSGIMIIVTNSTGTK
jgi:hypothetical protein